MNFDLEHHHAYVLDRQQRLRQESDARRLLTTPLDHTNAQHLTGRKDGSIMFRLISALRIGLAAAIAAAAVALVPAASAAASDGESGYIPFVTDFPQSGPVTDDTPVAPASGDAIDVGWLEVVAGGIAFAAVAVLLLAPALLVTRRTRLARG